MRAAASLLPLLVGLVACATGGDNPPAIVVSTDSTPATDLFPDLPDSLALTTSDGTRVLFSGARVGTDSLGGSCIERGLVLEREGTRKIVPLLMTGMTPTVINDSTIQARIWLNCRPGNTYQVNLRTATPTRVK